MTSDADQVCAEALTAAREARVAVEALNKARGAWSTDRVRFGLALHVGQVLYGNIGGGNRLDFTCIGPAVNLAARIEKIAGKLGRIVVASSEFATASTQTNGSTSANFRSPDFRGRRPSLACATKDAAVASAAAETPA